MNPCPLIRLFRIEIDWDISPLVGAGLPGFSTTVLIVTVVPLDRSSPSPTLNLLCHPPGFPIAPPMTVASITMIRASSTARWRQGRDVGPCCLDEPPGGRDAEPRGRAGLLLGGAT